MKMDFAGFRNEIIQLVDRADGTFVGCSYAGDRLWDLEDAVKELWELVQEFDCEIMDVDVDDITRRLTISIQLDDMVLEHGSNHKFFGLIQKASAFGFTKAEDKLCVYFHFDGLWR
jgi:undecaprenyl pyrophosphate synthase